MRIIIEVYQPENKINLAKLLEQSAEALYNGSMQAYLRDAKNRTVGKFYVELETTDPTPPMPVKTVNPLVVRFKR